MAMLTIQLIHYYHIFFVAANLFYPQNVQKSKNSIPVWFKKLCTSLFHRC